MLTEACQLRQVVGGVDANDLVSVTDFGGRDEFYGGVAKWPGSGLQIRLRRFESARHLQKVRVTPHQRIRLVFLMLLVGSKASALNCVDALGYGYAIVFNQHVIQGLDSEMERTIYSTLNYRVLKSKSHTGDDGLRFLEIQKVEYFTKGFSLKVDFSKKMKWRRYRNDGKSEALVEDAKLAYLGVLNVGGKKSTLYCLD